jgi:hypothetical protein
MNQTVKNILIAVLSAIVSILGGNAYYQNAALNDVQKAVVDLSGTVKSMHRNSIDNSESE